ncbi:MAG: hypothetical protein QOK19_787 [Solirubrobacteraceae bacterium]|nr:hypothetical protein [Solirubrobacterales bacterium]MEA2215226.1 hypothetical protein [Solirubrobacteraceae bacterium]
MARVNSSFTMGVPPERAQAMFVRDIVPDLHNDAGLALLEEHPGRLELAAGVVGARQGFDMVEATDPDVVGHGEEDEEPDVTRARLGGPATIFPVGGGRVGRKSAPVYSLLRRWTSRRLKVDFAPTADGTRVTLTGSAGRPLRDALARLGTPGHWPETADNPHD